jgi:esterase/lipase superfamily enzyme
VGLNRRLVSLPAPALGGRGDVLAYGHWGRPLLAFPSEQGHARQYEDFGMVDAVAPLLDAGRVKLYAVDSYDSASWHDDSLPLEERARRHGGYEAWIVEHVVPWIAEDSGGAREVMVTGVSFGAYHAANFALKRADLFPLAICQSGVYDVSAVGWGERGDAVYFNNPADYVTHFHGDHLDWLRSRVSLLLVCGQGQWEDTTGALVSTTRFAELLREKGIRCELDVWGHEWPHDWPSWRAQLAHHLPRFV